MFLQKFTITLIFTLVSSDLQPIVIVPHVKIFFGPPRESTSKFPPIIELFVQRLQTQFSTYVFEDLSRPATYEKPVYTLSPEEQVTATEPLVFAETATTETTIAEEEENLMRPNQYGTLVVHLKKSNSTDDASTNQQPILKAHLDIDVAIRITNNTKPWKNHLCINQ